MYDKLVTKVNNIDTSVFVFKTKYDTDKSDLEKIISDVGKKILILVELLEKQIIMLKLLKQNAKYLAYVVQLQPLHQLQLKLKYLMLVIQSKKLTLTQKLMKLKRKLLIIITINILLFQNLIS